MLKSGIPVIRLYAEEAPGAEEGEKVHEIY